MKLAAIVEEHSEESESMKLAATPAWLAASLAA